MASILVLGVKVPFTRGGQEVLVNSLCRELRARNHDVDVLELPYSPLPKESLLTQAAWWRSLDLNKIAGREVDLVIATKFPSYFARHKRKSLWLVHQHRAIYDLYGGRYSDFSDDPRDEALRRMLFEGDLAALRECSYRSGISRNVVKRLQEYCELDAQALYPPLPMGTAYRRGNFEPFILSVGRLCSIKRVDMMIKALPVVHSFVKLKVVGTPDEPGIMEYYKNEIDKHHLWDRVEFLGRVSDQDLLSLYSDCSAVYYAPHNEDYGYVTLEAFASAKPVVCCTDSGGVLEFVEHMQNGLVVDPTSDAVGHAFNALFEDKQLCKRLGASGHESLAQLGVLDSGWEHVIQSLLSPLSRNERLQVVG